MNEFLINVLINAGTAILSSAITACASIIISKSDLKKFFYNQFKSHKIAVFEAFISSFDNIYALAYSQKPFIIINAINNVLLYLDDTKRAPFIELRNALDVATEQDIEILQTKFDNCVAVLQEEVK